MERLKLGRARFELDVADLVLKQIEKLKASVVLEVEDRRKRITGTAGDAEVLYVGLKQQLPGREAQLAWPVWDIRTPHGKCLVIVLNIHQEGVAVLPEIRGAGRHAGLLACLREDGEEDRGQDGDDRYDDEQLDQRKAAMLPSPRRDQG